MTGLDMSTLKLLQKFLLKVETISNGYK